MRNDFCSNYLEHSNKGTTWKNVRYTARVKLANGKYRYFYSTADYQSYLKKQGGSNGQYAKANPNKEIAEKAAKESPQIANLVKRGAKGTTLEEKTKNMQNNIAKGEELISKVLSGLSSKSSGSSSGSKSSKGSSSSKSSKGSSNKKSTGKEKTTGKEKSSASSKSAEKSTKVTTKKEAKLKAQERAFTPESLKKLYGLKDSDVNKHESTEKLLSSLKSYKDGAFGYIMAGGKTYKWSKQGGNIVFKDFKSDKEVTLSSALKDIEEFRTDKKNKKK